MDIAKLTVQHDDNRCDAMHRMTSLDVTTSDTGAHNHSATLIFEQNQIYDKIDWIYFVELRYFQLRMELESR